MQRFEYKETVYWKASKWSFVDFLNAHGKEGWEHVGERDCGNRIELLLKRASNG